MDQRLQHIVEHYDEMCIGTDETSTTYPRSWDLHHGTPLHNIARYIWGKTPESPLYGSSREDLLSVARCSGTGNVLFIMQSLRFAPCSHWAAA